MKQKIKVSYIDFLNAVPLAWSFLQGHYRDRFQLINDVPSQCSRHLSTGEADVGLIPVVEYQRIDGLRIIPGISIASRCEVKSVLFITRRPISKIRKVVLDESSRTSIALLKLLLREKFGLRSVVFDECRVEAGEALKNFDGALIIGNPALAVDRSKCYIYDLAAEWNDWTGLPFVFAFWAVRPGVSLSKQDQRAFLDSKDAGLQALTQIAREYATRLRMPYLETLQYLRHNLDYSLDEKNRAGLMEFFSRTRQAGLTDRFEPLRFI